jgi:hypothetical protein
MPYASKCHSEIAKLYNDNISLIESFYQINRPLAVDELRKRAINGNTFRAFHKVKKDEQFGMCFFFSKAIKSIFEDDPTLESTQKTFMSEICRLANSKFKNWNCDNAGKAKILKLYNLYANYRVAFNSPGSFDTKQELLQRLKVPLDKYSLTFIRDLYNDKLNKREFKIPNNPSMGSIKSIEHYEDINKFIENLCASIPKINGKEFFPIYIDIIQASKNRLRWYTDNLMQ